MKYRLFIILVIFGLGSVSAQEFRFSAQLRERSEYNFKSFTPGAGPDVYHLLRTRFRADGFIDDNITVAFEIQDSRMFGIEGSTMNTGLHASGFTTAFDIRNAWVQLSDIGGSGIAGRVGRMPLDYGNSRFIGSREPYNVTQSFNGVVFTKSFGALTADGFVLMLRDRNFAPPGLPLTSYLVDGHCFGLWLDYDAPADVTAQAFVIHDRPILAEPALQNHPELEAFDGVRQMRTTAGGRLVAHPGPFHIDAEGAYQFGTLLGDEFMGRPERSIAAYFYALALGITVPGVDALTITAGYEFRTGDEMQNGTTGDAFEMFSTIHGNVYQYHGYVNNFRGQYAHNPALRNNGLTELYIRADVAVSENAVIHGRFHMFNEAEDPKEYLAPDIGYGTAVGMEANLWCNLKFTKSISMIAGTTMFEADADRAEVLGLKKTTSWSYLLWLFSI